jgi:hypothetical protein
MNGQERGYSTVDAETSCVLKTQEVKERLMRVFQEEDVCNILLQFFSQCNDDIVVHFFPENNAFTLSSMLQNGKVSNLTFRLEGISPEDNEESTMDFTLSTQVEILTPQGVAQLNIASPKSFYELRALIEGLVTNNKEQAPSPPEIDSPLVEYFCACFCAYLRKLLAQL